MLKNNDMNDLNFTCGCRRVTAFKCWEIEVVTHFIKLVNMSPIISKDEVGELDFKMSSFKMSSILCSYGQK